MIRRLSLIVIFLYTHICHANTPYPARITGQILAGNQQQLAGFADGMLPLFGNESQLFFADATLMPGQNQRMTISGGLGIRKMQTTAHGDGIFGAFVFADHFKSANNNTFWQANPGLEWLTATTQTRVQGYIPVSHKSKAYANSMASLIPLNVVQDSGRATSTITYATGHSIIDTPVSLTESIGPGIEVETGQYLNFSQGAWARIGGYHFQPAQSNAINGIQANLEVFINEQASVIIQDNYDNQNKNRFSFGVRVSLGGVKGPQNTLAKQMTTPIIRHIARQSYGEPTAIRKNFQVNGPSFVAIDNVWFFSPQGSLPLGGATTLANCTAENPCKTIDTPTATKINAIAPMAKFFFESGNYVIPQATPFVPGAQGWVNLQDGQTIWGRNPGWVSEAFGATRPNLQGALAWGHVGMGTIANGAIYNMQITNMGQAIPNAVLPVIIDSVIGAFANGNLTIKDSAFNVTSSGLSILTYGALANNDLTVYGSTIHTTGNRVIRGLDAVNNATVDTSTVTTRGNGGGIDNVIGVNAFNGIAHVSNSNVSATGEAALDRIAGVNANASDAIISNSRISAAAGGLPVVDFVAGVSAAGNVAVNDSTILANGGNGGPALLNIIAGIHTPTGNVTLNNTVVQANANALFNVAAGINAPSGNVTFLGNASRVTVTDGALITAINGTVINNSAPKSRCSKNGVESDC
jgi:hypothetical protein